MLMIEILFAYKYKQVFKIGYKFLSYPSLYLLHLYKYSQKVANKFTWNGDFIYLPAKY